MKRIFSIFLSVLLVVAAIDVGVHVFGQMSDMCTDNTVIATDVTNKRHKCVVVPIILRAKSVNLNAGANTDSGSTFTGLPSRYIVRRLTFDNASCTPTLSTVALRTAASGGGTAIVTAQALSALSASTTLVDSSLAVTTTAQTTSTLYLRNVAAVGSACTADATLEIEPLL